MGTPLEAESRPLTASALDVRGMTAWCFVGADSLTVAYAPPAGAALAKLPAVAHDPVGTVHAGLSPESLGPAPRGVECALCLATFYKGDSSVHSLVHRPSSSKSSGLHLPDPTVVRI